MKKTTLYIFVLALSLSLLCACGDRNNNDPVETPSPANDNAVGPDSGNVNDDDGIITEDDDRGILGGNHNDASGEDDRDNGGGAVGDIIDGDTPAMPEPNIGGGDDTNGKTGAGNGGVTGNEAENSRQAKLR